MGKTIVLLRHGRAEKASGSGRDEDRRLTKPGRRALERALPRALRLIGEDDRKDLELWSSGALRAEQTAALAADALGATPQTCGFLLEQDMAGLLGALADAKSRCVVVVGHNPLMERALLRLCGERLPLAPGGCAAVRVEDDLSGAGELLWFVQGPSAEPWKLLRRTERLLDARVREVERCLEAFVGNPEDVEALHSLRISVRVARGLLTFVEPFQDRGQNRLMLRCLKEVVSPTPRLRELDVLMGQIRGLGPSGQALLDACEQERRAECARACKRLRSKAVRRAMRECRRQAARVAWSGRVPLEGLPAARVRARLDELLDEVRERRASTNLADAERSHRLRKMAKAVRYAAENVPGIPKGRSREVAREMRGIQDVLGRLCDARCNLQIIEGFPSRDLPAEAQRSIRELRERNALLIDALLAEAGARA